jgi:uncharacterized membrane protein YhaH (DUF805 family)
MAMVEFPTEFVEQSPRKRASFLDVVFGLMVIVASGFSTYTTFKGYSYDFPAILAVAVSFIVGLGLIGTNFAIKQHRVNAMGLARPLAFFFIIFVFSFVSNTNAFYTYFIEKDIVGQTQEVAWGVFDSESTTLRVALEEDTGRLREAEKKRRLDIARKNLQTQIQDMNNPGLGPEAVVHLREISDILGESITPLRAPPSSAPMAEIIAYAGRLDSLIEEQYQFQIAESRAAEINSLITRIKELQNFYQQKIDRGEYDSRDTDLMKRDLEQLTNSTRSLVEFDGTIKEINNTSDATGSFQYTWTNFVNWINPAAIILSVLLGAMLDLVPPLMSILLFRPNEKF